MQNLFPPGYGYPSVDDWQKINAENDPSRVRKGFSMAWVWTLLAIYVIGFVLVFAMHVSYLGNVTLPLMLLRSAVWPFYIATGWPHGVPLPMD